ncbi:E3 ubiquitin-protein ligase TRIM35 [Sorex fumeus]|uniref:E3 ubiquitin-protein ligase TRIM35 n=1 Tax=Sorex fumeus TaxID=62283 RepID=UPI0024ACA0BF|nr:E3 ubiquitin-protein ligase TRIM35 [Sorex fumeus]
MDASCPAAVGPSRAFKEELLCAVCYDPFRDAVTLRCGHNFCRGCVNRCWEAQAAPACPVCQERALPGALRTNHTLNNLVEQLRRDEAQGGRPARLCRSHRAPLGLFCLDEQELLCCACQAEPRHQGHRVQPVGDTALDFRARCRNMEHALREKAKAFWAVRRSYEAIAKHNQGERAWLEGRIRREFEKLREFLEAEEQAVLDAVAEEARQKQGLADERMKRLAEDAEALTHEMERLQKELKEDDVSFLMKHKSRKRRLFCTMEPEPVQPGLLLDVCKHLDSLPYRVWRKMMASVESVPFSLDPNTAAGWLSVSEDLTSVSNQGYRVQVENPERFASAPCLLGSRTFSRGSHIWEVDLGALSSWRVGVARARANAGPEGQAHSCYHDARAGFWYLSRTQGVGGDHCVTSDPTASPLGPGLPRRLRVELDCDGGELSFYDAERGCHLYTFHARFGEVRPYFYVGGARGEGPGQPEAMRICPLRIVVRELLDS